MNSTPGTKQTELKQLEFVLLASEDYTIGSFAVFFSWLSTMLSKKVQALKPEKLESGVTIVFFFF